MTGTDGPLRVSESPSIRVIQLVDASAVGTPQALVSAELHRSMTSEDLVSVEDSWMPVREKGFARALRDGRTLEHRHWDWRRKIESLKSGRHQIISIRRHGQFEGLMAVLVEPRSSRLIPGGDSVLYVDYLEAAPWNLKGMTDRPRYLGIGTRLIAEAVLISREMGLEGRVGLHALPQAEEFYLNRCGMMRFGHDEHYYDLPYFEYTVQGASRFLASLKIG